MKTLREHELSTFYVTKFWETRGLLRVQGYLDPSISSTMLTYAQKGGMNGVDHAHGQDWWRDEGEARERIEQLRLTKVKNLERKITKLRNWDVARMPVKDVE